MLDDLHLTSQKRASLFATGFLVVLTLGTFAVIGLCIAAFWLLVEVCSLLLQVTIETLSTIGQTYGEADPMIRFLLLVAIGYVLYRLGRHIFRRAQR